MRCSLFLLFGLILVASASAQGIDAQAQAIAAHLRCPVCQNESIADSPAELASQIRALIHEKLAAGETPEQITAYFVSRYGEWILLEPPRRGLMWVVWIAPPAVLLLGVAVAATFLRRAVRRHQLSTLGSSATARTLSPREDRRDQSVDC
jgi:cytochrome c-type biogenesis protein CcmH